MTDGAKRKGTRAEWSTAYREAGHAVAAIELKRAFKYVTIIPGEDTLGHIRFEGFGSDFHPDHDVSPRVRAKLERAIMCSLAGGIAEAKFRGRHNHRGASGDYFNTVDFAEYVTHSVKEAEAYINWLSIRTAHLFSLPYVWAGVAGLAAALIEQRHIGSRAARQIVRDSMRAYTDTGLAEDRVDITATKSQTEGD